jgi:tripartite-type tricarboxylate transporter receptor subunit TctC
MRVAIANAFISFALAVAASGAAAQGFPTHPIRLIVPQSAGGSTDLAARAVTQKLSEVLKQNVVVDNRPGAGSINGTEIVAKALPDGHTLLAVAASFTITPALVAKLTYDPVRDFTPVTQLADLAHVLVMHPSVPAKSVKDLIALGKSRPGALNYASSGIGTSTHMAAELFLYMTGTQMVNVPYKGGAPAMVAMLGGQCQVNFATSSTALPHIKAEKLRALAVTTGQRSVFLPELPTVAEAGVPGYAHSSWVGVLAPARTPRSIIDRLNSELARTVQLPEIKKLLAAEGLEALGNSQKQFEEVIRTESERWRKLVKTAGIKAE